MSDVLDNNPKKEVLMSLVAVVLFAAMAVGIGMAGWLRPAGDHVDVDKLNAAAEAELSQQTTNQ